MFEILEHLPHSKTRIQQNEMAVNWSCRKWPNTTLDMLELQWPTLEAKRDQTFVLFITFGPCHEKSCLWAFQPGHAQTSLLSIFVSDKVSYHTFQRVHNKDAGHAVQMCRLVCAFVVTLQ